MSARSPRAAAAAAALSILATFASTGCTSALRGTGPDLAADLGVPAASTLSSSAAALLAEARSTFARRPDRDAVRAAARLWAGAALADPAGIEGLLGFGKATAWLVEHEERPDVRTLLATRGVSAGEWCLRRSPANPSCDYALAIAVGQQARERPATALDGLKRMVEALTRAAAGDEMQDFAGPRRVLALVYLRAPGWPAGPGDPEAGLVEARRAVELFPSHPPNLLALGEALRKSGAGPQAVRAYEWARDFARAARKGGEPDAPEWLAEALAALGPPSAPVPPAAPPPPSDSWAPAPPAAGGTGPGGGSGR